MSSAVDREGSSLDEPYGEPDSEPDSEPAGEPPQAAVRLREVRFRYRKGGDEILRIDHLDVAAAEHVFVRGPSGCGKTTLLSLVAGVLTASEGEVALLGTDWRSLSPSQRDRMRADHVGYIFQQFNLLPYLSVLDNVLLPCRFSARRRARAGGSAETTRGAATELLLRMGLGRAFLSRRVTELSVGQQQRVAASRALIGSPDVVIADEPTSALDETLRASFMAVLLQACTAAGSALVFVSHDDRLSAGFDRRIDLAALNRASKSPSEVPA